MSVSKKKLAAIEAAISRTYMQLLDANFPQWQQTPPDQMSVAELKLFDALGEFERLATQRVREALTAHQSGRTS